MKKKNVLWKKVGITVAGVIALVAAAVFCYGSVKKTIVANEQESLKSMAEVNAQSLGAGILAKSDLLYAVLSGDMDSLDDVEKGMIKLKEKSTYVSSEEIDNMERWQKNVLNSAIENPVEVLIGPVKQTEEGFYVLYMTKAVSVQGRITGCVQVELNLDEMYTEEQGLADLQLGNDGYCIVKAGDEVVMPSAYNQAELSLSHTASNGCTVEWVYETKAGTPQSRRKLIAFSTVKAGNEELVLYIIEDYDKVLQPIENISFYLILIGIAFLVWVIVFTYMITEHRKKEQLLMKELQHEKVMNETMKKQEGLMQKYNHSKTMSVLTGSIAHEFNNLMTPIVLYTDLLEENEVVYREMPDEIAELKSATKRCEELAKQLLSYSRQGKAEKVLTDYDATYAVRESVNMVRKLLPANISFKESICKTTYHIHGQVGALNQILLNLTTNAMHAMKDGGTLSIQFGLSTDDDRKVRLVVEDTGSGIPDEIKRQVFQPFFTTKQAGEGTGIGLTVVKRLTEEHGGTIRVKTDVGKGTMFILDFPRVMDVE